MRTRLGTWALAAALGLPLFAQAAEGQHRGAKRESVETRVARMREGLGLSDDQAARIETILKDAAAKPVGDGREDRMARRQQVRQRIDEVLTPEQREKRDKLAAERKAGRGGRRGGR